MLRNKKGFTLVELMVVAVIVAILAAVTIPLMAGNTKRAIATEADTALGTIRSALRTVRAETSAYNVGPSGAITIGTVIRTTAGGVPGFAAGDLNGRWFTDACYTISAISATTFTITCTGSNTAAPSPRSTQVGHMVITMNQDGDITRSGV